ncbi:MAG: 16S rRNA (cytidine(1402)-2'-O)-methyltransferase [Gammaproteobacteria bacterium]|nr:16S rRNA (cytidine(1402)-2'-O)-methyltransferase [Gammaproteobacteria bacterium]
MSATLYIIATPIGNLEDLSPRAIATLQQVDLIAAEDTRHSKKLLHSFAITTPMIALHDHNEAAASEKLIEQLQNGQSIALISDAGTPLISDPGYTLVSRAHQVGIPVSPLPGPCAAITALSASGLPSDRFLFIGFLPARHEARQKQLSALKSVNATLIFYESRHRIVDCLNDMATILGQQRLAFIGRELTKQFETVRQAPLAKLCDWLQQDNNQQRGEFVVIVAGADKQPTELDKARNLAILQPLLAELPLSQAVRLAAKISGCHKNRLYDLAITLKK